ncbi:hypothetical protein ACFO0A_06845 [Novosphingobium tardum]|uniref:Uncharacterized protein n=1 Tax=Novosphingobium tardum TaxID=1538021 RepID=A0ABV8RNC1_9SPHN
MSGTEQLGILGLGAALIALVATLADRRRVRRTNLDAAGFMPWTPIFFGSLMIACVALGLALRAWFAG